jgi:hypothetical protein
MQFIKVDIDGTGKKWRLAVIREQGTMYYFPEEDLEDLVENYDDCEKKPVPRPDAMSVAADELAEAIGHIVDGELWAGRVECINCEYSWVACAPWNVEKFECPECGQMDGEKTESPSQAMVRLIVTTLVDYCGVPAVLALNWVESSLYDDKYGLESLLNPAITLDARQAVHDMRPKCPACNGDGGDCDAGDDGQTVSWSCPECGGTGRDYSR